MNKIEAVTVQRKRKMDTSVEYPPNTEQLATDEDEYEEEEEDDFLRI